MPRYRVTLTATTTEIVEAANQYQAAIVARELGGDIVEVLNVTPAVGRPPVATSRRAATKLAKTVAKKRRPMSAENRAKLAQNLVKARAARAANAKATKKKATPTKAKHTATKK